MNIIPLSREYLDEAIRVANAIFPDDAATDYNPSLGLTSSLKNPASDPYWKEHRLERLAYWLVLDDTTSEVIGITGLYRTADDPQGLVWLGWYGIRDDHRGTGLGRRLLEWTIERARSGGYRTLKLFTTTDPNEARAQKLYESMGFHIVSHEAMPEGLTKLYRERAL